MRTANQILSLIGTETCEEWDSYVNQTTGDRFTIVQTREKDKSRRIYVVNATDATVLLDIGADEADEVYRALYYFKTGSMSPEE